MSGATTPAGGTPERGGPDMIRVISMLLLGALALLIVYPLGMTVFDAATRVTSEGERSVPWAAILAMLRNTAMVVVLSSIVALAVAALLAWIDERTDARLPLIGQLMPLFPLLLPPVAGVMGWGILLDSNAGFLNIALRKLLAPLGFEANSGPIEVYSFAGLVLLTGLYLVPYIYLILSAAFRRIDPSIEEAARVFGASPFKTFIRVTLPAIAPAIGAAVVMCTIAGLGLFSVPFVIGTGARIDVLSVYVFRLLEHYPPNTGLALALAFAMMMVVQLLLIGQRYFSREGRSAGIGGRGFRVNREQLGRWRWLARGFVLAYVTITVLLPLLALLLVSFQPFWTPDINWSVLSLQNYRVAFLQSGPVSQSLVNSLGLGAITATVTMLVIGFIVLFGHFNRSFEARAADTLTAIPATIPHTVIGVSFLIAFALPPFNLRNSLLVLLAAYVVMALPFAGRTAIATAAGIGRELGEAARVCGASGLRIFFRIMLPLAAPGLAAGWAIIFIQTAGEVTASAILAGSQTPVIGRVLMDLWNYGSFPQVAALAIGVTIINSTVIALILWLSNRTLAGIGK
ncbi:MAG: iron ABC transporter permease [Vannielia sp.]|uniref:ABC transporter permease n=1 Tax=Rhodobacterales TaxID=204455 RepID=UPI0020957707|nr:ABC transporter permease subunit [Oceanicola sp. 502str15]MCO6383443.1 ABC transporter permease subunit [Oceanicola sp. 502str15]